MTEHKHSGIESYANNPGTVSESAGNVIPKEEHAPDPLYVRRPVTPLPAIPVDEKGRPIPGLDLGERSRMTDAALSMKLSEAESETKEKEQIRVDFGKQ